MRLKSLNYNSLVFPLLILALWQPGSCGNHNSSTVVKQEQHHVTNGSWGGQNILLDLTESGAQVQFSCSHGTIDQALVLDDEGHFSARGTFTAQTPGPQREDNPPKTQPAIYRGAVKDKTMTLAVVLTKTNAEAGSFTLEYGKPGRIRRCH